MGIHLVLPLALFFLHLFLFSDHRLFQSLIARSREKSRFLHEHKEDWDRLINEAWLHRDVTTQLRQRVADLTPLVVEANNLRRWAAEACQDAEDAKKSFDELSKRAWRDEEEAARVWKERDELLQWDTETRQRIIDLLAEAEKERDLRLVAKERSMALEQRAKLDAEAVTQLHKE